jgi:DNA-binding protein HU-beta
MSKANLIQVIHEAGGLKSKAAAERALDAVLGTITEELAAGNEIHLRGFGSFKVKELAARRGRDFKSGKSLTIPARKSVKFEPGTELKHSINTGKAKAFLENVEKRLGDLKKGLEDLAAKDGLKHQIEKLQGAFEDSKGKLAQLQGASGEAFGDLKRGFDSAFRQLRSAFTKAKGK